MDNLPKNQNTNEQPFAPGISSDQSPPPPPPSPPADNNPSLQPQPTEVSSDSVAQSTPVTTQPPSNMPPPMPEPPQQEQTSQQPAAPEPQPSNVVAGGSKKSGVLKKILLIVLLIIFAGVGIFAVWKILIPRLGGVTESIGGGGETNLTWWGLWEEEEIVKPIIDKYQSDNPGVTITYVGQSKKDYRERLQNALARGEGPDIFRYHNSWVPMFNAELSRMPSSVMTSQEYAQTFYPAAVSDLSTSDGIVGIPLMYDGLGLYINEDIFTTYGKTPPETWDELRALALELTIKNENDQIQQAGVSMGLTGNVDHWQEVIALMILQNGGKLSNPSSDLVLGAVEYYKQFADVLGVWDSSLPPSTIMFGNGNLAMYFGPSWRALEIIDMNPSLNFKVVPVPQLPKEDEAEPDIAYASYWAEGVWQGSNDKNEAWKFLKYLSEKNTLEQFYASASQVRRFGEPYPRADMREMLLADSVVGGIVATAPEAKSWFLYSRTFDGETGLNSRLSDYYADLINSERPENTAESTASGVIQVLSQYGLAKAPTPTVEP